MAKEKTFYSGENVNVTSSRLRYGSTTFLMRNINSVETGIIPANHGLSIKLIAGGVIVAIIGYYLMWQLLLVGILAAILGGFLFTTEKETYTIHVETSSGKPLTIPATQQAAFDIERAINEAIAEQS